MRHTFSELLQGVDQLVPDLTLGELIVLYEKIDFYVNQQLAICPVSDTLDLRSSHITRHTYSADSLDDLRKEALDG